ncbi:MAG: RNA polymerase sporulation sigma factor SigG [Eubacteriales bacterium]|nr:RNA polymerase sporulation sigma factor SigG [Eubacteriales bacterium]
MPGYKVDLCGIDTSSLPVMKNARMMELIPLAHEGDLDARTAIIQGNLRLVLSVIQRFSNRGEAADDLFQVGCVGLMKAIDRFDVSQGVRFSTYAVPMIMGELRRYLRDSTKVRVTRSLRDLAYKALQARDALLEEHHREPTITEIAEKMGAEREEIVFALEAIQEPVSLYEPIYNDSGDAIYVMDQIRDTTVSDETWIQELTLREALRRLNEREKKILAMRFYQGRTQMEVADEIGISQAQVSRLEKNALLKVKKML